MATLLKIVASGIAGVMLGLLVTIFTLNPESRGLVAGPWRGSPRDGAPDIDPYSLAGINRSGVLPLGAAEGLSFFARTDSAGAVLSPACDYIVAGAMPIARFWTLSVATPDGFPIANPAQRYGFTSAEVLRQGHDPVAVAVGPEARAGNWLIVAGTTPFMLALRLYDTGLSAVGSTFDATTLPTVRRQRCH